MHRRWLALASGLLIGLAVVPLLRPETLIAIVEAAILMGVLVVVARAVAPERSSVARLIVLAYSLHLAAAMWLRAGALAAGLEDGFFGDDGSYFRLARGFASWLNGDPVTPFVPPFWNGDAYLFGTFVYLEGLAFALFGPHVELILVMNGAFFCAAGLIVYDLARRWFGHRPAFLSLALILFLPSLVLWSSLNLKDALAILVLTATLWANDRFRSKPNPYLFALMYALLLPMESLRRYLFVGLALLIPVGVVLGEAVSLRRRFGWTAGSAGLSLLLIIGNESVSLGPGLIGLLETSRQGMTINARTAYVDLPLYVSVGETYIVPTAAPTQPEAPLPSPTRSPAAGAPAPSSAAPIAPCTPPPGPVHVSPNARIVVITAAGSALSSVSPNVVVVCPGTIIVVGDAPATGNAEPWPLPAGEVRFAEQTVDAGIVLARTLEHLPTGLAYALLAPFPWSVRRPLDWPPVAEMLLWYVALPAAVIAAWRRRREWDRWLVVALYIAGCLGLFSLAEGNVGTLYRHRSMVIPMTLLLAGPTLLDLWHKARGRTAT